MTRRTLRSNQAFHLRDPAVRRRPGVLRRSLRDLLDVEEAVDFMLDDLRLTLTLEDRLGIGESGTGLSTPPVIPGGAGG